MAKLLSWNGSAWVPAKVWNGSAWVGWVAPVYGAAAYTQQFTGTTDGWIATGPYANGVNLHANGHIYTNNDANAYGTSSYLSKSIGAFYIRPGQTVRVSARMMLQKSVNAGVGTNTQFYLRFAFLHGSSSSSSVLSGSYTGGEAGGVWNTVNSNVFTAPVDAQEIPYLITPNDAYATSEKALVCAGSGGTGALGPLNKYNFFVDWFQIEDSAGAVLMKKTVDAVDPIKVWHASASKWL